MDQENFQPGLTPASPDIEKYPDVESYRRHVIERLSVLTPIFAKASVGDFSGTFEIGEAEDEFMNLYVGVWVMLEVIRAQISELKDLNLSLEKQLVEIEEAKAKDDALLGSIGDGVIAINKEEKIIYLNQVAEKMFGWQSEEIVGKSCYEFCSIVDEKNNPVPLSKSPIRLALLSNQRLENSSYYYARRDKTSFPGSVTISPIILNNQVEGVMMAIRDITKEKEVDRAKDELISLASHQLRTPLAIIKWSTEKLLSKNAENLNAEQKEYLQDVNSTNQRMVDLVNALLNVSRMELGTFVGQSEQVDLQAMIKTVIHELNPQITKKKINVEESYDPTATSITADPKLPRIIIQNLLSNSAKYAPENGIIKVSLSSYQSQNEPQDDIPRVLLRVEDNGCGIPQSVQSKIFSKMFRADNAKKIDPDGNGLGLYIVRSAVDRMKGQVWFESEEGKGSVFYAIMPVKEPPAELSEQAIKSASIFIQPQ